MEKSETQVVKSGGCEDYRLGLVLSALRRRLDQGVDAEEDKALRREIADIEERLGL